MLATCANLHLTLPQILVLAITSSAGRCHSRTPADPNGRSCLLNTTTLPPSPLLQVADIEAAEKSKMREKCEKILAHGINCFINRQLIYNYPEEIFADAGGQECWIWGTGVLQVPG